jgi:hypothetical protein
MSLTVFIALSILGCDFLIYFLYRWLLGEKRSTRSTCANASRPPANKPPVIPFPQSANASRSDSRLRSAERLAHQRIAASFVRSRA